MDDRMSKDSLSSRAELLPCPFCGGKAEIEQEGSPRRSTSYACTDCGCRLETGEEWRFGRRWNERQGAREPSEISYKTPVEETTPEHHR